jgi:enamine deaminase RidA (YjgF/YER057c/UK114 family)
MELCEFEKNLPEPVKAVGNYVLLKEIGKTVYSSGIIPVSGGKLVFQGRLGAEISIEQGQECARQCVLNVLSLLKEKYGSLNVISEVVSVKAIIASTPDFIDHPKVANGASDFLVEIFGDKGRHVRAAFGASSLPLGAPVEIEFAFRLSER